LDPHAADYPSLSAYVYVADNPLIFIDPDGRDAIVAINVQNRTVTISTNIYIYGSGASTTTASTMQKNIMNAWNNGSKYKDENGVEYKVIFDVNVKVYNPEKPKAGPGFFSGKNNPFSSDNYIEVDNKATRSYVSGGDEGCWRAKGRNGKSLALDDSAPHEFGHLIGLADRYTEGKGANVGWSGNIMAESAMKGKVEQKNIDAILNNQFTSNFYDFEKDYNSRIEANKSNLNWSTKGFGIPYIHNKIDPVYKTKIDENNPSW
jgi:hypothetical protein